MKALFDTNVLIDYFRGCHAAAEELKRYSTRLISVMTTMELLVGARDRGDELQLRGLLASFEEVELSSPVMERAVMLRRQHRLKLPDAIVYASAQVEDCPLVTRNHHDFPPAWPDVRIPYAL